MKNRNIVMIIAALCMIIMGACFSPWDGSGSQGNIVINVGSGARLAASDIKEYKITLTDSGETSISKTTPGGTVDFSVPPGNWNILVRAMGNMVGGIGPIIPPSSPSSDDVLIGYGKKDVEVKAGAITDVTVTVELLPEGVTEVVSAWTDLENALEKATKNETVMLTSNLRVNSSIQIPSGKNITLLAQGSVTIKKADNGNFDNSMFRVPSDSSLTLGVKEGMPGTITFDGNKENYSGKSSSSLIYVGNQRIYSPSDRRTEGDGGTLTIYKSVFLTNNYANARSNDRGGAVVVDNGTFYMYGGEIYGNTNTDKGGGVRVLSGTFTKTDGIIYGNEVTVGAKKNTATSGQAVYYETSKTAIDTTLWQDNNLPKQ